MRIFEDTGKHEPPSAMHRFVEKLLGAGSVIVLVFIVLYAFSFFSSPASAHGGRLAADGCHMDRSTGVRHCHRGPNAGQASRQRDGTPYYPNCDAARAAGVAPIRRGQPGYGRHLDRDGDGIACER